MKKCILVCILIAMVLAGCSFKKESKYADDFEIEEVKKHISYASDDSVELWSLVEKKPNRKELEKVGRDYMSVYIQRLDKKYMYEEELPQGREDVEVGQIYQDENTENNEYETLVCIGYRIVPCKFVYENDKYVKKITWFKEEYDANVWRSDDALLT